MLYFYKIDRWSMKRNKFRGSFQIRLKFRIEIVKLLILHPRINLKRAIWQHIKLLEPKMLSVRHYNAQNLLTKTKQISLIWNLCFLSGIRINLEAKKLKRLSKMLKIILIAITNRSMWFQNLQTKPLLHQLISNTLCLRLLQIVTIL